MGLNKVVTEIRANAEKEAQRIIKEGRMEGEKIFDEARKRLKEQEETIRNERAGAFEQINVRSQTILKKQMKDFTMNAKKELVEKVYQEFLDYLKNAKGDERTRLFRKMVASTKSQISRPRVVYVRKEDTAIARKLFRGLEVRTKEMDGGFMLESGDGKEVVDFRFETLVELLKGRTLKNVSKTLFGGQGG